MQESSSHISQILLRSVNKSMCKQVQLFCVSKVRGLVSSEVALLTVYISKRLDS